MVTDCDWGWTVDGPADDPHRTDLAAYAACGRILCGIGIRRRAFMHAIYSGDMSADDYAAMLLEVSELTEAYAAGAEMAW